MSANTGLKVTAAMKEDFDACMAILKPSIPELHKQDLRGVLQDYGREYAAQWLKGWRVTLESMREEGKT